MNHDIEKKLDEIKNSAWAFFVNKRQVAWLFIIGTIIFGSIAMINLPREIQPEITIPIGAVATFLPGASPPDTESLVTEPLEKEIATISEIKSLTSTSGFGNSVIAVEFEAKADLEKSIQDLKDAVDRIKNDLPEDATDPSVMRIEANEFAIVTYSLIGNRPLYELTNIAEEIELYMEKISGVSRVDIVGGQKEIIRVTLDQKKVENLGLEISNISNIIKFSNTNLPLGVISTDKVNYSLRIDNRYQSLSDIANLPVTSDISLKDIAKIEQVYPEQNVLTKLSQNGEKSLTAVSLQIYKKSGGNILGIVDATKAEMEKLKLDGIIPSDVQIAVSNDNSMFIRTDLGTLTTNGYQTILMVIAILFLAMGLRQGLIASLSVPLTFLITFAVMDFMGLSINSLSLFALVISLGIMVDTSIVIMQGIHANIKEGHSSITSSLMAIETFRWPLIAGTMTTIFAFFPMLLVSGILGEFLRTLPIVISTALFASLFIGITITPAITSRFLNSEKERNKSGLLEPYFRKLGKGLDHLMEKIVQKKSVRVLSIVIMLVLFAASLSLPITGILPVQMFPNTDQQYFIVRVEAPKGSVLDKTIESAEAVEEILYTIPEIENFLTIIGSTQSPAITEGISVGGGNESSNIANITVNLVENEKRTRKSYDIATDLEQKLGKFKSNLKITVQQIQEGPPSDAAVSIKITGKDLTVLKDLTKQVEQIVKETKGTKDIKNSLSGGLNEFKFVLDRDLLAFHGLSAVQVSANIRTILQGVKSTSVKFNGEDIDIYLSYNLPEENNRTNLSISDIKNFAIQTPKGQSVTLSQLGTYDFGESPDSISHEDQKRIISLTADVEKDANSVEITQKIQQEIAKIKIPAGYEVGFGGEFEDIAESFNELFRSMIVGIILIAFCLILEFNSFRQAFVILMTLPLALIGVFPGLLAIGLYLSFPAFLGIVALAGVVVNNAIVLIDRINENRRMGVPFAKAISEATNSRLEPIFMTTITTIIGIIPLALSNEFWAGLGFSLVFGLAFSTILTLLIIPTLYYTFEAKRAAKENQ